MNYDNFTIGQPTQTGHYWIRFDEDNRCFMAIVKWQSLKDPTLIFQLAEDSEFAYKITEIHSYQGPITPK